MKLNWKTWVLIAIGTIVWSLTMVRSGWIYPYGVGFWGANGHDAVWHLALAESLSRGSLLMPVFAGAKIQNYHIGFDLILAILHKITFIPIINLYFQIIPPIMAFAIGLLTYKFVFTWRKSEIESWLAVFFVYFGGSLGWLVSLIRGQGWGGESMFWSQESLSTLINPSFALSLIVILLGLIYLKKYLDKKTPLNFCVTALLFGLSTFIKVYAGLLVLTSIFAASLWNIFKKKDWSLLGITLVSLTISLLLFFPFNKASANLVLFQPFWFLQTMLVATDRFNWPKLYSAMTTYTMGGIWAKAVLTYILAFMIFIVGNLSTRLIAIGSLIRKPRKFFNVGVIEIFIFILISAGIIVPMFFIQKGTPWNTIQFFYYSLMFSGIVAGVELGELVSKASLIKRNLIIIIVILVTIPTTFASMGNYFPEKPQSILPIGEVEALKFLSKQPDGIVLTYPFDKDAADAAKAPRPLYLYTSTAYVSAFSNKETFLEDEINLDIMQYSWQDRRTSVVSFLNEVNTTTAQIFLKKNNISYVYWVGGQHATIPNVNLGLTQIFKNNDVTILKVK